MRATELNDKTRSSDQADDQVAFHPDGTPMTRQEYKIALETAEKQIKNGDFVSIDELEKE